MSKTLSQRDITGITTGGYIHIIIPDNNSITGFTSYRIAADNFIQTPVLKFLAKNSDFQVNLTANTYLSKILVRKQASSPNIKVGTTAGASDLVQLTSITDFHEFVISRHWNSSQTIYFTISGGSVDIRFEPVPSYF